MNARINTVGRAIDEVVAGRLVSHLRLAAGACALAAGLLMGSAGGAVAVADPDSSGSAASGDGGTNVVRPGQHDGEQPGRPRYEHSAQDDSARDEHPSVGPTTRPARRENPEESAWRHRHSGREGSLGSRRRGPRCGCRSSQRGRAGY